MKHSSRLFQCARCQMQTLVCSDCDRGQIYCGEKCARAARVQSCQAAEKRYQKTFNGKMKHALRQRRYRASKQKVTDQGSPLPAQNGLLEPVENKPNNGLEHCHFCKKPVSSWLRQGFLRRRVTAPVQKPSYWQPPLTKTITKEVIT